MSMSPIDQAFHNFEEAIQGTRSIRQGLIHDLKNKINIVEMDPDNESPRTIEVKVQLINTLAGLLKDEESVMERNVKLNLSRKESEDNTQVAAPIGALLKAINLNGNNGGSGEPANMSAAGAGVEEAFQKSGQEITEGELQECQGGPTTSAPVDEKKILEEPKKED